MDYDTERDFAANNNVQVYYEGLEDEIIRRIEVGTVTVPASPLPLHHRRRSRPTTSASTPRFEVGPVQFQTLAATQKGSQVAERIYTVGQTTSQPQDRQVRDLDFETGRFFWVVDPDGLPGYPAIDILNLARRGCQPTDRPTRCGSTATAPPPNQSGAEPESRRHHRPRPQQRRPARASARSAGSC